MPAKTPNPDWFDGMLEKAKKKAGGTWEDLAEQLGVTRNTASGWAGEYGRPPKLHDFLNLLKYVGGDIERARPEWQVFPQASKAIRQENVELRGKVGELKDMLAAIQSITIEGVGSIPPKYHIRRGSSEIRRFVLNEPPAKPEKE